MHWNGPLAPGQYWGKLHRPDPQRPPERWHPLVDHCIDVACCAEVLLTRTLLGSRLATLGRLPSLSRVLIARLCVLAGLHDLGKYNHGFQAKDGRGGPTAGHVSEGLALLHCATGGGPSAGRVLDALALDMICSWFTSEEGAFALLQASICHHGRPLPVLGSDTLPFGWKAQRGCDPLHGVNALNRRLLEGFPAALEEDGPLPHNPEFVHAFMGLMTLADWLGSDQRVFQFTEPEDPPRAVLARDAAARLLLRAGLDSTSARARLGGRAPEFQLLTRQRYAPRPLQQAVLDLPLPEQPSIALIESETGSGKTEAALAHFFALYAAGLVDGLFFALPTRAAAVQLHTRVHQAVVGVLGEDDTAPPVVLAVPGYLRVDDQEGQRGLERFEVLWTDDPWGHSHARRWAAENSKRFLSGAIVVGTIDQGLLATLRVNHSHLRAVSLMRQLLVVDEVHASDEYMGTLLKDLLRRHRAAGGHALLMSATYGAEARARLLGEPRTEPLSEARCAPYPRVIWQVGDTRRSFAPPDAGRSRRVRWEVQALGDGLEGVAAQAVEAARSGARVILLRNTVKDALATQAAVEELAPPALLFSCAGQRCPHHGRYAPEDRRALDRALGERFVAPGGFVVVSTQTLEQSLDIDADLLITDLCPMDVLLQRVGRLHRHDRPRPEGYEQARCVVLTPESEEDLLELCERKGGPHGWGTVYPNLVILLATWRMLKAQPFVTIPADNRLLVEGVLHSEVLHSVAAEHPLWAEHLRGCSGKAMVAKNLAGLQMLGWDQDLTHQQSLFPKDGCTPTMTRLGEEGRMLRFDPPVRSPFGNELRTITMPSHWNAVIPPEIEVVRACPNGDGFTFEAGRCWGYTRWGLGVAQD